MKLFTLLTVIVTAIGLTSCAITKKRPTHFFNLDNINTSPGSVTVTSTSGSEKSYAKLEDAIQKLKDGDEITLPEGGFIGPYDFSKAKNILVKGQGRKTVITSSIVSNEITFRNLDFFSRGQGMYFEIKTGRVWLENVNFRGNGGYTVKASNNYTPENTALVWILGTNENIESDVLANAGSEFDNRNSAKILVGIFATEPKMSTDQSRDTVYFCKNSYFGKTFHGMKEADAICNTYLSKFELSESDKIKAAKWLSDEKVKNDMITQHYNLTDYPEFKKILHRKLLNLLSSTSMSPTEKLQFTIADVNTAMKEKNYLTAAYMAKKLAEAGDRAAELSLTKAKEAIASQYACKVFGDGSKYAYSKKSVQQYSKTFTTYIREKTPLFTVASDSTKTNCRVDINFDYYVTSTYSKLRYESKTYTRETVESSNRRRAAMNAARDAQLKASFANASQSIAAAKHNWSNAIDKRLQLKKTSSGYEMSYWKNKKNANTMASNNQPKKYVAGGAEFETVTKTSEYGQCVERTFIRVPLKISSQFGRTVQFDEEQVVVVENGKEFKKPSYTPCNTTYRSFGSYHVVYHMRDITFGNFEGYVNKFFFPNILQKVHKKNKSKYDLTESLLLSTGIGIDTKDLKKEEQQFKTLFGADPKSAMDELTVI